MNRDLTLINLLAHKRRTSFNPDPNKQAAEVTFSKKRSAVNHPPIFFNEVPVKNVQEQKYLGITLDSKLSLACHIKAVISKSWQGTGMLRFLSEYVPRRTLNEMYKLYVRPHLDYRDVIYHIPQNICEFSHRVVLTNQMEKLESVQYSTALAVTGAWKGTPRDKLYDELGWESMATRTLGKINGRLRFLHRKQNFLDLSLRKLLANALIQPHFDYACSAWFPLLNERLTKKIQTAQNKCIRFWLNLNNRAHIGIKEFKDINWLPTKERFEQCTATKIFKFFVNSAPSYMFEISSPAGQIRVTRKSTKQT